jgi:pimeloyl-ACP methyl ester carboxylesterase
MKIQITLIGLLLIASAQLCLAQVKKAVSAGKKEVGRYADIRGIKMYYEVYGAGAPVLFVHGNGGSTKNFDHQISFFAKKYKVILADSRAQGKSVDDADSLSYEMMADDLNGLLDYLKMDSAFVVGWSDGGINGLLLAMRHPEKVKKLAITGANLWPDTTALDPWLYRSMISSYDSLSKIKTTPKLANDRKLLKLMIDQPNITLEQLGKITIPTLVIGGDHDVILPKHTLQIAEAIPKSYLWILPNSGHSTLVNYSSEFNKTVADFFVKPFRKLEGAGRFE